jgi:RNA polymerase sigma-70 factor (ECF subfamily)
MKERELDKEAFCGLVLEQQAALYRTARSILGNDQDAQDAVQEAITAAFARLHTLRDPTKFKPWLLRILINCCYDACRRRKGTVDIGPLEEVLPAKEGDREGNLMLWEAVKRLPAPQRQAVALFYYEGFSISEISRLVGATQGAVKTRLARARGRLREMLEP